MTGLVLVTGGTGTLGRLVLPRLQEAGQPVRVLSRTPHSDVDGIEYVVGDLATGAGVEAAVAGVATILHCAGSAKGDEVKARHLLRAAVPSGVAHLVFISVVGADRIPITSRLDQAMFGYFGAKHAAERLIADSGLPFTTLRATQFHELALATVRALGKLPVIPAPAIRFQPIAAREVADRLVELTLGPPAGLVPDLGGPEAHLLADLVRSYLRATGRRRLILPVRQPGAAARSLMAGANLTLAHAVGRQTWAEFLAEQVGRDPVTAERGDAPRTA